MQLITGRLMDYHPSFMSTTIDFNSPTDAKNGGVSLSSHLQLLE